MLARKDLQQFWKFLIIKRVQMSYLRARPPPPSASPPNTCDTLGARVSTGKEVEELWARCLSRCSPRWSRSPAVCRAPIPWSGVFETLGERVSNCIRTHRWQTGFATVCASRVNKLDLKRND